LGVGQNESVHPELEAQPSPNENPKSQQALNHVQFENDSSCRLGLVGFAPM
jgi:hypothetical protein